MTSYQGDFRLSGSITGAYGAVNAFSAFTSKSGQITIDPTLWRRAERNRSGDRFTFTVRRAVASVVNLQGKAGEHLRIRLAEALTNGPHEIKLLPAADAPQPGDLESRIEYLEVFQPPLKR